MSRVSSSIVSACSPVSRTSAVTIASMLSPRLDIPYVRARRVERCDLPVVRVKNYGAVGGYDCVEIGGFFRHTVCSIVYGGCVANREHELTSKCRRPGAIKHRLARITLASAQSGDFRLVPGCNRSFQTSSTGPLCIGNIGCSSNRNRNTRNAT